MKIIVILLLIFAVSCQTQPNKNTIRKKAQESATEHDSLGQGRKQLSDSASIIVVSLCRDTIVKVQYAAEKNNVPNSADDTDKYSDYIKGYSTLNDTIEGDFNGDGIKERAWYEVDQDCIRKNPNHDYCKCTFIRFSDPAIKSITIDALCKTTTQGCFQNEGDINGDGKDEIGVLLGWDISSSCRSLEIYSLVNARWKHVFTIHNTYNMREVGITLIEADKQRQGYTVIKVPYLWWDSYKEENGLPELSPKIFDMRLKSGCAESDVIEFSIKIH